MSRYYTRACNFYFGTVSKEKVKKRLSIPIHGNNLISFDTIEVFSRKSSKKSQYKKKLKKLNNKLKKKF